MSEHFQKKALWPHTSCGQAYLQQDIRCRLTETSLVSVEGPWMLDSSSEGKVAGASAALNVVAVDQIRY